MCDLTPVRNWLLAVFAAIVAAVAVIVTAAAANGSWWYAWTSPGLMVSAAATTAVAVFLCGRALSALETYCKCVGDSCRGACANMRNAINAARTVLGIQAAACLSAVLVAWIPWVAQPVMYVIIGALLSQLAMIFYAILVLSKLRECAVKPPVGQTGGTGAFDSAAAARRS